jgi:hypothetical protein
MRNGNNKRNVEINKSIYIELFRTLKKSMMITSLVVIKELIKITMMIKMMNSGLMMMMNV